MMNSDDQASLKFISVGFSLREKYGIHRSWNKPGCNVISFDSSIQEAHPIHGEPAWEKIGDRVNPLEDLRYDIKIILEAYNKTINKEKYAIFCYGVERDNIPEGNDDLPEFPELLGKYKGFRYALVDPKPPVGRFLGFEVNDIELDGMSLYHNPDINWEIMEECGRLNDYHLFNEYEAAKCFRERAAILQPGHAPYAIWAIHHVDPDACDM